ncbi:MAG: hypothetical protein M1268_02020 [Patescibacteria group bacterium]|nr:hypothetical protein [Patescibacteria group bacterium]
MNFKKLFFLKKKLFLRFSLNKRQKFVIAVLVLSLGLFFSENLFGKSGFYFSFILAFLTDFLLFWSDYRDIKENPSPYTFVLPFFYSLSLSLFYFLAPTRIITRIIMTSFYALGLYSLFLTQNIFTVAAIRTIALTSSARIVSFIITIISFFFLTNIVFSMRLPIWLTAILMMIFSFPLIIQSLWTTTLENSFRAYALWALGLSVCLFEVSVTLWFWPSSPTIIALFLTGGFYSIVGLSHIWFAKRLFKGVMWEYIWVAVVSSAILILFTPWGG